MPICLRSHFQDENDHGHGKSGDEDEFVIAQIVGIEESEGVMFLKAHGSERVIEFPSECEGLPQTLSALEEVEYVAHSLQLSWLTWIPNKLIVLQHRYHWYHCGCHVSFNVNTVANANTCSPQRQYQWYLFVPLALDLLAQ